MSAHMDAAALAKRLIAPKGWLLWATDDGAIYVHQPEEHDGCLRTSGFYIRRPWLKAHDFDAEIVQAEVHKRIERIEAR